MKKLLTLFVVAFAAMNMMADNVVQLNKFTYADAFFAGDAWIIAMYETQPEDDDYTYPFLYVEIPYSGTYAIAGTYTFDDPMEKIQYYYTEEDFDSADEASAFVVTYIEPGLYHYSLTFSYEDGWTGEVTTYKLDADIPTVGEVQLRDAVENVSVEHDTARKYIRDGQVFILRGEKAYTLTGQEVK